MSRGERVYRLDELDVYDRFELRLNGVSYYGWVIGDDARGIYIEWETPGNGPDDVIWPPNTLVRMA